MKIITIPKTVVLIKDSRLYVEDPVAVDVSFCNEIKIECSNEDTTFINANQENTKIKTTIEVFYKEAIPIIYSDGQDTDGNSYTIQNGQLILHQLSSSLPDTYDIPKRFFFNGELYNLKGIGGTEPITGDSLKSYTLTLPDSITSITANTLKIKGILNISSTLWNTLRANLRILTSENKDHWIFENNEDLKVIRKNQDVVLFSDDTDNLWHLKGGDTLQDQYGNVYEYNSADHNYTLKSIGSQPTMTTAFSFKGDLTLQQYNVGESSNGNLTKIEDLTLSLTYDHFKFPNTVTEIGILNNFKGTLDISNLDENAIPTNEGFYNSVGEGSILICTESQFNQLGLEGGVTTKGNMTIQTTGQHTED